MLYKVKIVPIIPTVEILKGPFQTEKEAQEWIEQNNNPFVDYWIVPADEADDSLPWDE